MSPIVTFHSRTATCDFCERPIPPEDEEDATWRLDGPEEKIRTSYGTWMGSPKGTVLLCSECREIVPVSELRLMLDQAIEADRERRARS